MTGPLQVAILGGRGMLGADLAATCSAMGHAVRVYDLPECDVTNTGHVRAAIAGAGAVVNCAAYTNVDGAETQRDLAMEVNAAAVGRIGEIGRRAKVWVLHISTDFVFDGKGDRPYAEADSPNPISVYGLSKWQGEQALAASGCDHCIVRIQWTYGRAGKNFVTKLLDRARSGADLKVVDDQVGSPTATVEVSKALACLIRARPTGLFHFAAAGYVSRYDMAKFIAERLGLANRVLPCKTSEYPTPAARPLNSRFDCNRIRAFLDGAIEPWQGPLGRFVESL